jgi:hypothetical protein
MDTETLGLHPDAPVWEFAAIRRSAKEYPESFCIKHDPTGWLDDFPEPFLGDYRRRFVRPFSEKYAAHAIHTITRGAHIVGAVPNFDTERLAKLLQRNGIEPEWHYHLIDVENLVMGWLHGVAARAVDEARMRGEEPDSSLMNRRGPPYKSDELSLAIGVDPEQFERHTAMGDVLWVKAQYDAVMGGTA